MSQNVQRTAENRGGRPARATNGQHVQRMAPNRGGRPARATNGQHVQRMAPNKAGRSARATNGQHVQRTATNAKEPNEWLGTVRAKRAYRHAPAPKVTSELASQLILWSSGPLVASQSRLCYFAAASGPSVCLHECLSSLASLHLPPWLQYILSTSPSLVCRRS